jgi:hypothetical protein
LEQMDDVLDMKIKNQATKPAENVLK